MRVAAARSCFRRIVLLIFRNVVKRLDGGFPPFLIQKFRKIVFVDGAEVAVRAFERIIQHEVIISLVVRPDGVEHSRNLIRARRFRPRERRIIHSQPFQQGKKIVPGIGQTVVGSSPFPVGPRRAIP